MPTDTVPTNERTASAAVPETGGSSEAEALRKLALRHLENVRRFKLYLVTYILGMAVLTPVWIITQYETAGGWPDHLSSRSRYPGDWDPWLIWVGLIGAFLVGLAAIRAYFFRGETEGDVEREMERLRSRR